MPTVDEFRSEIRSQFREAESRSLDHIQINSGQLHRKLGGYPGPKAQMPSCCQAMYHEQNRGDEIISQPLKGYGASLTIRYRLPRLSTGVSGTPGGQKPQVGLVKRQIPAVPPIVNTSSRLMKVEGYDFQLICEIKPQKNPDGTVKQFMPQSRYENYNNIQLHKYGKGPFCKFGFLLEQNLREYIFIH